MAGKKKLSRYCLECIAYFQTAVMESFIPAEQDLRGGSKGMYLGGAPPNMPPCSQWGALIYASRPQWGTWWRATEIHPFRDLP